MKVFAEEHYNYIGKWGKFHAFKCTKTNFDQEIVLVTRAKMVRKNGHSTVFNPITDVEDVDLSCVRKYLDIDEMAYPVVEKVAMTKEPIAGISTPVNIPRLTKVSSNFKEIV